ncbi:hypothetical protein M0802_017008 [Mischocyttarus mexicanus]|nr:hypothetical protein M0802_017008 [Mischocyttarus mexicanus]
MVCTYSLMSMVYWVVLLGWKGWVTGLINFGGYVNDSFIGLALTNLSTNWITYYFDLLDRLFNINKYNL